MSDTPETDKAEFVYNGIEASGYVKVEFAQQLERERDKWRECAEKLAGALWQESPSLEIPSAKHSALMECEKLKQSDKWSESVIKTASTL